MTETNIVEFSNQQNYKAYKLNLDKKPAISFVIYTKSGDVILYPYIFMPPAKLERKTENCYEIGFSGGGINIILQLKYFNDSDHQEFIKGLATRKLYEIHEFSGDSETADSPIIAKITVF